MKPTDPSRANALRAVIADFLIKRRDGKLEKLAPDDPQREVLRQQFTPADWLEDAARRAGQIQAVTHSLKPVHPDAKGTNLYVSPATLDQANVVGSHCLVDGFTIDFVCDAKLLPTIAFLKLEHAGSSLLELCVEKDASLATALSEDPAQAHAWMQAFATLVTPRGRLASHTLAKQLYWQSGDDPLDDGGFHLLAPLYASSLAHRVFETLQDDRFSDASKTAREAKKANTFSERPVREYPQLAVQKLGGSNTQNVSHLNSKRRGNNSLLASMPPVWRSADLQPLLRTESMFHRYGHRPDVRQNVKALLAFLKTDPKRNLATRGKRAAWVRLLIDEFLQFTAQLRSLEPGWSQTAACRLGDAESRWLDPDGVAATDAALERVPPNDVPERISAAFANWLNAQLLDPLPMGDAEFLEWRKEMHEQIKAEEREGLYAE